MKCMARAVGVVLSVMDSSARLRSRWSWSRHHAWRVLAIALGMPVVTAAAAVLIARVFRLPVAPVVVGILGTLPALGLAVLALLSGNGRGRRLARGRPARQWDPVQLGVHEVIGGGALPRYVPRQHDELLAAVLDRRVAASRLVVIRGGSSTGKSRAAYQAVLESLPDWRLDYPRNAAILAERLDGGLSPRTVLWLRELRDYASDADGSRALGRLADLLDAQERFIVITTIWPDDWRAYVATAPGTARGESAGAGRLLAGLPELSGSRPEHVSPGCGGVVEIPEEFTTAELDRAARDGDAVVAAAVAAARAAGAPGQIAQYLAGVPDLLSQYEGNGSGQDPYGQAMITAAMDAVRLGHADPLPSGLLRDAASGYLTDQQRAVDIDSWWPDAFTYATQKLKGAIRAVEPVPPTKGIGIVGYRAADYLEQHGRRTRRGELGPASLWDALATWAASSEDMSRLGRAARNRGLYRHAAILWTRAVSKGSTRAAARLVRLLRDIDRGQARVAAQWAASQVSLDNPGRVATLLRALRGSERMTPSPHC